MLIMVSSLLCVSQSLLYFQKRFRSKHESTIPRLRNTIDFGSGDGIEVLLSPKLALYNCRHEAVQFVHVILGDLISLLCRRSGGCKGGGGEMNAALLYGKTVL